MQHKLAAAKLAAYPYLVESLSNQQYILPQINDPNGPVFYEGKYHV